MIPRLAKFLPTCLGMLVFSNPSAASGAQHFDLIPSAPTKSQPRRYDPNDIWVPEYYDVQIMAKGLSYLTDITFGAKGEVYLASAGGYSFGTTSGTTTSPPMILQLLHDGTTKVIYDNAPSLAEIRAAKRDEDIPDGLIPPITGVTYNADNHLLYITHRSRISTLNPETGEFKTIIRDLPAWGPFQNHKVIFGPEGDMYFFVSTQSHLGPVDVEFQRTQAIFGKRWKQDFPCEDVELRGVNFMTEDLFTSDPDDREVTGVYVPFGTETFPGQVIEGRQKCNGSMYRARADGSALRVMAWGFKSGMGYRFSPDGTRLVTSQSRCTSVPPRQVHDDREALYEVKAGRWYGWPDYCNGTPITAARFHSPHTQSSHDPTPVHEFVLSDATRNALLGSEQGPPPPLAWLPAHSATRGLLWGQEEFGLSEEEIIVAEMGAMAPDPRLEPIGFKVQVVNLKTGSIRDLVTNKAPGPASSTGSAGLERPVMMEWGPNGGLYLVDFGVIEATQDGLQAIPGTAAIWKIRHLVLND